MHIIRHISMKYKQCQRHILAPIDGITTGIGQRGCYCQSAGHQVVEGGLSQERLHIRSTLRLAHVFYHIMWISNAINDEFDRVSFSLEHPCTTLSQRVTKRSHPRPLRECRPDQTRQHPTTILYIRERVWPCKQLIHALINDQSSF